MAERRTCRVCSADCEGDDDYPQTYIDLWLNGEGPEIDLCEMCHDAIDDLILEFFDRPVAKKEVKSLIDEALRCELNDVQELAWDLLRQAASRTRDSRDRPVIDSMCTGTYEEACDYFVKLGWLRPHTQSGNHIFIEVKKGVRYGTEASERAGDAPEAAADHAE